MLIYRIENDYGDGPYWKCEVTQNIDGEEFRIWQTRSHMDIIHPSPFSDGLLKYGHISDVFLSLYFYGFSSMKQLRDWFNDEELENLFLCDYKISVYDICPVMQYPMTFMGKSLDKNVIELGKQTCFIRKNAVLKHKVDISDILEES